MKLFNKRPIVLFACIMLAFIYVFVYNNSSLLKLIFAVVGSAFILISTIILALIKNKTFRYIISRLLIISMAIVCALSSIKISEVLYSRDKFDYSGWVTITGRVSKVGTLYDTESVKRRIIIDNATISCDEFSKDLHHNVLVTVLIDADDEDLLCVGNNIKTFAYIQSADLYYKGEYGLSFNYRNENIGASGYTLEEYIVKTNDDINLTLSDKIKQKVEDIIQNNLDPEFTGLATGMLFGDDETLDPTIKDDFSATGVAHLLAVSGLHVGFLLTLLHFISKLIRLKGLPKFIVVTIILWLYAYLCGFSVSVVRATVMAMCSLFASIRSKRYDGINALSIALIIVLIINPFSSTTVGFKLSFIAVLSIILLAKPIAFVFNKIFNRKLANTFATLLAVQLGTSCVMFSYFNKISLITIVANFITIPIASFAYMVLFVTIGISIICPFLSISVYLFQFIMLADVKLVHFMASATAITKTSASGIILFGFTLPAMYFSSDYIQFNSFIKYVISVALWISSLFILLFV